jgi:hypothetical protein
MWCLYAASCKQPSQQQQHVAPSHHHPPARCRTCFLSFAGRSLSTSALRRRIITVLVSSRLSSSSFWLPSCV